MKLLSAPVFSAFGVAEGNGEKGENERDVQRGKAFGSRSADMSVKEGLSWQIQSRKANDLESESFLFH